MTDSQHFKVPEHWGSCAATTVTEAIASNWKNKDFIVSRYGLFAERGKSYLMR